MKNKLIFHINAITEYKNASIWYEQQKEGLGLQFEKAIETKLYQIKENPFTFSFIKGTFRGSS